MTRKSPANTSGLGTMKTATLGTATLFLSMASCAIFIGIAIQSNNLFIPLAGAVLAGLGVLVTVIFRRKLAAGVNLVEDNLARLAEGDINLNFPDEEGEADFANMIQSITTISDTAEANMSLQMDYSGQVAAIGKAQAVIEFNMDGTVISANDLFLNAVGYTLAEIKGQHHRMFVDPDFRETAEYRSFWDRLNRGEYDSGVYKRIGKGGREVWLRASYNPILDLDGKPFKVVKYASDITEDRIRNADFAGQIEAIGKAQAVIEFNMDGTVISANDLFLNVIGYRLDEIKGQHHRMFVEPAFRESVEYHGFWDKLNRGEYESKEFKRIGKGGREVWIQASYNPIMDLNGKPFKVVKYATDITRQKQQNIINQHIKTATDGVKTNIMMVDTDHTVVYMNKTMQDMIKTRETQLRTDLPALDFNNPVGARIDAFHRDPSCLRKILDNSGTVSESHIEIGGMEFDLVISRIHDADGKPAGTVIEWEDVTVTMARELEQQRIAAENQRIRIALDNASTNMMVADKDFNIVYMNDALLKMMREAENDLRKVLPNFDAKGIIGSNIDIFHKNPAHQRGMLQNITTTISSNIKVGIFDFNLTVNPVTDESGERLGTVVEWRDMSQELAIEAEIDKVVQATLAGDFTQRVTTEGKQGFMLGLAKNINEIGSTTQTATDDMAWIMAQLAKGDLTEKIETEYQGTFDLLKNSSNETVDQLTDIVTKVNQSAGEVASASAELSTGSDDLSRRTEAQASALEETAASMEQLAVTVKQNADNARDANELAGKSREMAVNGGAVAKEAVEAMGVIEESSQKVSDIIGVIDDLAFQTNLLALNAAVEAARAGEAGKGFAVVAEEVRTLAQRSAQASNEIKSLITSSNTQVKNGVELVNDAGAVLGDIMESISKVATIVSEIASASSEQTQGIDEVNVAIAEMDDMTQQNSSLVEESTAAARVLERQAAEMQRLMSFFDVGTAGGQQAVLSPILLQQQRVKRSMTPEIAVTSGQARKIASNGTKGHEAGWAEF